MKKMYFLAIGFFFAFYVAAQNQETPPVTLEKISDNLYQIMGGRGANGGMYIGDNEVVIIDSKMDKTSVDGIFSAVKKVTGKPVTLLVNTHSDGDHVNGNPFFPPQVTIVAHENCRKEILLPQRDGAPSMWLTPEMQAFLPEITFNDKMQLHLGSKTIELYYFGVGHTTGDIVVYFPEEKTAFIGDQAFFGRPQLIHSYKGGNSFEHVKTLTNMLKTIDAENFCSGHADIKTRTDIENHLAEIAAFQQKVKNQASEGKTLEQIQAAFSENEARLVESVYNELKEM
ncbi:MAG: MBL fold metallo-hydrolase [Prolixibacteraceae bacterium]|nr:MBL fold metallo-hydrolase [Prolixibacteraceae bacterium]